MLVRTDTPSVRVGVGETKRGMVSGGLRAVALLLAVAAPAVTRADTAAAEVAALLDFCSANPGMLYTSRTLAGASRTTPICGSGTITNARLGHDDDGNYLGRGDRAQWGNGDPCAGDGWYGVTCDAAGEHVTAMCARFPLCTACPAYSVW